MASDHIELYRDSQGGWRWRYKADNGRILADSGEGYRRRIDAIRMAARLFPTTPIDQEVAI